MSRGVLTPATLLLLAACAREAQPPLRVFAAASLTKVFHELSQAFTAAHAGVAVDLHFAGSPQLVLQLREGAAADLFAAADTHTMQKAQDAGLLAGEPLEFARNGLAIGVREGNPRSVQSLACLARQDLVVALCGPEVPAGRYARAALAKAGVSVRSISDEPSVNAILTKLQLGEIDAGIVYATDLRHAGLTAVPIAAAQDVVASYPLARLRRSQHPAAADFEAFLRGATGRAILQAHGFLLP
jgi:molybdate transport system substrate-binding protein